MIKSRSLTLDVSSFNGSRCRKKETSKWFKSRRFSADQISSSFWLKSRKIRRKSSQMVESAGKTRQVTFGSLDLFDI